MNKDKYHKEIEQTALVAADRDADLSHAPHSLTTLYVHLKCKLQVKFFTKIMQCVY